MIVLELQYFLKLRCGKADLAPRVLAQISLLNLRNSGKHCLLNVLLFAITLIFSSELSHAQDTPPIDSWKIYPSYNRINDVAHISEGKVWAATSGGLFQVEDTSITRTVTTLDNLYRPDGNGMVYYPGEDKLIISYIDGHIDVYDPETGNVEDVEDIKRAQQYTSKNINSMRVQGEQLYVATDFGVVVFNLNTLLVEDTYSKLGAFARGTAVNDVSIAGDSIYCAANEGLAKADLRENLLLSENWNTLSSDSVFDGNPLEKIEFFNGRLFVSTSSQNYQFTGEWGPSYLFNEGPIQNYHISQNRTHITGVSESSITMVDRGNQINDYHFPSYSFTSIKSFNIENGLELWIGTERNGVAKFDPETSDLTFYKPDGPYINFFEQITVDQEGNLVAGTGGQGVSNRRNKGYHILRNGSWKGYNYYNTEIFNERRFFQAYRTTSTENYYYIGTWGHGIVKHHKETDSVEVYQVDNSNISGRSSAPQFIIGAGLDVDSEERVWTSVYKSQGTSVYYQHPDDDDWQSVPRPTEVRSGDIHFGMFIDSYDQKWIPLVNSDLNGRGLLVMQTNDPETSADDQAVRLTDDPDQGNLPNNTVNAFAQDKNDEIYIGTNRGVARFSLPTRIISGNATDRRAQWLINADTTATSPFLLRDIQATSITVNAANQKWVGTRNTGLWLINSEGNRILEHFTVDNSPLISNNIISTDLDNRSGTLYIATDKGLISYTGVPKEPVASMEDLFIYPNPYSYNSNSDGIIIENLSESTKVQILGVDGRVVNTLEARGGRITWNARTYTGKKVATGVYIAVAVDSDNDQKAYGKILIVR